MKKILIFIFALLMGIFGVVQTPWAKKKIGHKITEILEKRTGLPFTIDSLTGFFPFTFSAHVKADHLPLSYEDDKMVAKGNVSVDCVAGGSILKPKIGGRVTLNEAYFESIKTGMVFENIDATLTGEQNHFILKELTGDHIISGQGEVKLNSRLPFTLDLQLKDAPLYTLDPLLAKGDAKISLIGSLKRIDLQGDITLFQGSFEIPEKVELPIPKIKVVYAGERIEEEIHKEDQFPFFVDLSIHAPKNFFIMGRGIHSVWKGNLTITGRTDNLQYRGSLHAIEGQYQIVGKILDLTAGHIGISGLEPNKIDLNIKGALELPLISVIVKVSGKASKPNFYVTSNPPMETTEILSKILFNQSLDELTPLQACRLVQLVMGAGGATPDVLESIKRRFGIDVLDLAKSSFNEEDLAVKIGKYLGKGVFIGLSKSLANETGSVLFQSRFFRNLFFSADYGTSLDGENQGKLALKWHKSF